MFIYSGEPERSLRSLSPVVISIAQFPAIVKRLARMFRTSRYDTQLVVYIQS